VRRFMRRHLSVAILVMALLALAACGGAATDTGNDGGNGGGSDATEAPDTGGNDGGGDGGTGDGIDLCATLTLDEVSDAAGVEATEQQGANLGTGQASCNYNGDDGLAIAGHTYTTALSGVDPLQMFDANLEAAGAEEIDGIGERAVLVGSDDFPILWVVKNDAIYAMSVLAANLDAEGKREATVELARKAVDRLP